MKSSKVLYNIFTSSIAIFTFIGNIAISDRAFANPFYASVNFNMSGWEISCWPTTNSAAFCRARKSLSNGGAIQIDSSRDEIIHAYSKCGNRNEKWNIVHQKRVKNGNYIVPVYDSITRYVNSCNINPSEIIGTDDFLWVVSMISK